jgi:hypothetical protein
MTEVDKALRIAVYGGSLGLRNGNSSNGSFNKYFKKYKDVHVPDPKLERKMALCEQLSYGFDSALARSWIVLCFFSIGLGLAPRIERSLRPRDYAASETRMRDRRLSFYFVPILLVLTTLLIRTHGSWMHYFKNNSATLAATLINSNGAVDAEGEVERLREALREIAKSNNGWKAKKLAEEALKQ